jgi:hypothetical protein
MFPTPKRVFLTRGIGVHRYALTAFEFALRDADIEQQNLVYVSSILPPRCQVIRREEGVEVLKPGDITFCVLARSETNEIWAPRLRQHRLGDAGRSGRLWVYFGIARLRHDGGGKRRTGGGSRRDDVGLDTGARL